MKYYNFLLNKHILFYIKNHVKENGIILIIIKYYFDKILINQQIKKLKYNNTKIIYYSIINDDLYYKFDKYDKLLPRPYSFFNNFLFHISHKYTKFPKLYLYENNIIKIHFKFIKLKPSGEVFHIKEYKINQLFNPIYNI